MRVKELRNILSNYPDEAEISAYYNLYIEDEEIELTLKNTTRSRMKKSKNKTKKEKGSELVKTAKYFWAWGRKNLTFKMIVIGTVAFILGVELIRGLFF